MADTKSASFPQVGDSVRRLQAEADKVVNRVRTRLNDLARNPGKQFGDLVNEARRVRGDVRSRVETAVRSVEDRLEKRVSQLVKPVTRYLDIASSEDVEELRRRVASLEKQIGDLDKSARAA
jgi:polyhydroxyalkanoate synthesis regulator phasin